MKILAVGGGSGGHVTPVVAVLREIKSRHKNVDIQFWCDKKFAPQATGIMHKFDPDIVVQTIHSGKLRRYHHLKWWQHLQLNILLPNLRDVFFVVVGIFQSLFKMFQYKPDVVFTKGGFVCVPVGFAAHLLRIPIIVHDSDAHPGLANRILSRWALRIATGAPLSFYNYPTRKSHYVGTPVDSSFKIYSASHQQAAKAKLGVDPSKPLIVITGGGLGAQRLNDVVITTLDQLLPMASVVLVSGTKQYNELKQQSPSNPNFILIDFVKEGMADIMGAADVIVTRAGATALLEVAALAKPTIVVPNGRLTGGHQLKNAAVYKTANAVRMVDDDMMYADPDLLVNEVKGLLLDKDERKRLASAIHRLAKPRAASDMADIITRAAVRKR